MAQPIRLQTPIDYMALDGTLYVEDNQPYMVFCHEWVQIVDGTVEYVRLDKDLAEAIGSPVRMFNGSACCVAEPGESYVTDGCFMYRTRTGKLLMIWASFGPDGYAECVAESLTGKISGPWRQQSEPLFKKDGGHAMISSLPGLTARNIHLFATLNLIWIVAFYRLSIYENLIMAYVRRQNSLMATSLHLL